MENVLVSIWVALAAYEMIGWLAIVSLLSIDLMRWIKTKVNNQ